jgi:hypothetical protein
MNRAEILQVLKDIQWAGKYGSQHICDEQPHDACPLCDADFPTHDPLCRLAKAIVDLERPMAQQSIEAYLTAAVPGRMALDDEGVGSGNRFTAP